MPSIIKCVQLDATPRQIERPVIEVVTPPLDDSTVENDVENEAEAAAKQIIADARKTAEAVQIESQKQADKLIAAAEAEASQLRAAAHDEGYEAGYKDGMNKGLTDGTAEGSSKGYAEYHDKLEKANQFIINAQQEAKDFVAAAERPILDLAFAIAKKILAREVSENPMVVLPVVKEALAKISDQTNIVIRVSPDDYELVQAARISLQASAGCEESLTVVADETIHAGEGCLIDTANGMIDAKLDTQYQLLQATLQKKLP